MMIKENYVKIFVQESTKTIRESAQYGIYLSNDEFKKFFVEPFTDVLKVAKVALKDVGSGVLYNMRILFTFSTTKKQRLLNAYEQSREKYKKEYEPLMKKIGEGMEDAKYLLFMANPPGFIAAAALKQGVAAGKFVLDTFEEQRDAMDGKGPSGPTKPDDGPILGALKDLKRIFFGESYIVGQLLEAEGESPDVEAEVSSSMEEAGVDTEKMRQDFGDWIKVKETAIKDIEDEGIPDRINALVAMMNSKDYDELQKAVASAKSAGLDLGNYVKDFEVELKRGNEEIEVAFEKESEENAKEAAADDEVKAGEADDSGKAKDKKKEPKLIASLRKLPKIKKLGDKATKDDFLDAAQESLFNTLKDNLQEDGQKIISEIQVEMTELAGLVLAPFNDVTEMAKLKDSSSEAAAIVGKIEKMVKTITG